MVECFRDFIGLQGLCPDVTPESGLYITDMPVGGLRRMSDLTDPDRVSALAVWEKIQSRASNFLVSDVRKAFPYTFKTAPILANVISGDRVDPFLSTGGTGKWVGVFIRINGSQTMEWSLNWLRVWLDSACDVPVKVWDTQTGTLLKSETFTGAIGDNIFNLGLSVPIYNGMRELFVAMDDSDGVSTVFDTCQTTVQTAEWCGQHGVSKWASMQGASIAAASTNPLTSQLTLSSNSGGLIVSYSLNCSLSAFVCMNRMSLATAFLYKCVLELYQEVLEGDSIFNRFTMIPSEEIRKRIEEYTGKYWEELNGVLARIQPSDGICIECAHPITTQYVTG